MLTDVLLSGSGRCWAAERYNPVPGIVRGAPASQGYRPGQEVDQVCVCVGGGGVLSACRLLLLFLYHLTRCSRHLCAKRQRQNKPTTHTHTSHQVRDQLRMLIAAGDRVHSPTPAAEFCEKVRCAVCG